MNYLIENGYALRILWSYIKIKIEKYNLKYLVLPVIYFIAILLVLPKTIPVVTYFTSTKQDSYIVYALTKEEKKNYILEKYDLTDKEFKVIVGIVLSEAETNSYEDAYAVINTIYNRTQSKKWIKYINSIYGDNKGLSLYYQAIAPNQFTVYKSGKYKNNINNTKNKGYDAIIDFLYTENILHNYLSFRSNYIKIDGSATFSSNGNNYFNELKEENRI